jgi:hypothetical protein
MENYITLKNVKYAATLSEETNAFTASVYFKSGRVAYAKNTGQGGNTMIDRDNSQSNSKPTRWATMHRHLESMDPVVSLEDIVDDLLVDYLMRRDIKKDLGRYIVGYDSVDAKLYTWIPRMKGKQVKLNLIDPDALDKYIVGIQKNNKTVTVLNRLPIEEVIVYVKKVHVAREIARR